MAGKSRYSLAMLTEAGENISSGQSKDRPGAGLGPASDNLFHLPWQPPTRVMALPSTIAGISPENKRCEWTVLYHIAPPESAFKGRGEFLKLMFEDAQMDYHFTNQGIYGPQGYCDMFRDPAKKGNGDEVKPISAPFPVMYPPVLWHRPGPATGESAVTEGEPEGGEEVMINQVSACMAYIGGQLGYRPSSEPERARADCITAKMRN
jgi:hypothetical protein